MAEDATDGDYWDSDRDGYFTAYAERWEAFRAHSPSDLAALRAQALDERNHLQLHEQGEEVSFLSLAHPNETDPDPEEVAVRFARLRRTKAHVRSQIMDLNDRITVIDRLMSYRLASATPAGSPVPSLPNANPDLLDATGREAATPRAATVARMRDAARLLERDTALVDGAKSDLVIALQNAGHDMGDPVKSLDLTAGHVGEAVSPTNAARLRLYRAFLDGLTEET